jgi:diacylglycerol O-acyltransferase
VSELQDAIREVNDMRAVGEQMTGFDAATWRTALADRTMRSPVMALVLLDSVPDWDRLRKRFDRLTRVIPVLRQRPLSGVLGVSTPRLGVDPDFDLDVHLHRMSLPEGTGWEQVLLEARRMSLTDFDLDRPLWEASLIEGLEGGRSALLVKLHHAIADGQATVMIGANLFEFTAEGTPNEPPAPPAPVVSDVTHREVSRANIADNVRRGLDLATSGAKLLAGLAAGTVKDPMGTWGDAAEMVGSVGRFTAVPESEMSPIMAQRGTTYHFAVFDMPFAEMKAASKRRKASVNDIFLASVSTGMARYHDRYGKPADQLRFNIPISLRSASKDGSAANAVTIARFPLPVNNASIEDRLDAAHEQVRRWREEPALTLANPLADASWLVPVPVLASAAKKSDVTTSNVPGPPIPLYIAGARAVGIWPLVATIGAAVNITMVTYDGTAFVGLSADDRGVPDLEILVADLRSGFAEVLEEKIGPADPVSTAPSSDADSHAAAVRKEGAKPPAKKTPAKKTTAKKATAKKTAAKKSTAKKTTSRAAGAAKKATSAAKKTAKAAAAKAQSDD